MCIKYGQNALFLGLIIYTSLILALILMNIYLSYFNKCKKHDII